MGQVRLLARRAHLSARIQPRQVARRLTCRLVEQELTVSRPRTVGMERTMLAQVLRPLH